MQSITGMTASDWAAWVGAIGTIAAAWLAVWLYFRSRSDARADERARRKVLHAVLREYVLSAAAFVQQSAEQLRDPRFNDFDGSTRMALLVLQDVERLIDLQVRLMDFGEDGDAEIAAFIEACRRYDQTHRRWQEMADNRSFWETLDGQDLPIGLLHVRAALDRVADTAGPALAAIERFDKP